MWEGKCRSANVSHTNVNPYYLKEGLAARAALNPHVLEEQRPCLLEVAAGHGWGWGEEERGRERERKV